MTQYQIECRSRGQSMANFRFFSFEGQHYFTGSHSSFVCALHETYKKIGEKNGPKSLLFGPIQFFIEVAHLWLCATFLSYFGGSVEAFGSKIAQIGVHNL